MGESFNEVMIALDAGLADVVQAAILTLRAHYPGIRADLDNGKVCLRSELHSDRYMRAAWAAVFFTEARIPTHMAARQAVLDRLMA